MKIYLYVIMLILFIGCKDNAVQDNQKSTWQNQQLNVISQKFGLQIFGMGGFNENGIKGYSFSFQSNDKVDVDRARVLIVKIMNELLIESNKSFHEKGNPTLGLNNYDVMIVFANPISQKLYSTDVGLAAVKASWSDLYYYVDQPNSKKLDKIFDERFSDAYRMVTGEKFVESTAQNTFK